MTENARVLMETIFNIFYLLVVWGFVVAMYARRDRVAPQDKRAAMCIMLAFALLAFGDTGHVGFRVLAYAMDGLGTQVILFGQPMSLIGLGSLATAWTFTLFYVFLLFMWKYRTGSAFGAVAWLVLVLAAARSLIMLHPENGWTSLDIREPWYTLRNIPLVLMQAGTLLLLFRDSRRLHDRMLLWVGVMILISFLCYAPIIVLYSAYPGIGMLMVPKTLAYLGVAVIVYRYFYGSKRPGQLQ